MNHLLLAGASGRLGQEIIAAGRNKSFTIHPIQRHELSIIGDKITDLKSTSEDQFIIVDVTLPEGTEQIMQALIDEKLQSCLRAVVIGSTGHSNAQLSRMRHLANRLPVVLSTNFSRGVFFFEEALKAKTSSGASVSELARQLGFDISMWESHHILKKDAPSGTARTIADAAAIPHERITSSRVGAIVGEHVVMFSQESEELRFTHTAHARKLFAEGALDLCERMFRSHLPANLYSTAEAYRTLLKSN